jgi:PAS domain S-box-containing protein
MSNATLGQSSGLHSGAADRGRGLAARGTPSHSRRRTWAVATGRYALAFWTVALAAWARWMIERRVGPLPTFVTFYPAVLLVASLAGGGPGIVATVLAALVADYWFIAPIGFGATAPADQLAIAIFTGANLGLCLLAERLRRARWAEAVSAAQEQDLALLDMGNVLALDPDHRIRRWSEGCRRLYGFDAAEAEGRFADELLQTRYAATEAEARRVLSAQGHWEGEVRRRRKDGGELVIAVLRAERHDEHGRPSAVLEVSNNVTDRKRAEDALLQAKLEWERTFDAVPDLIAILDDGQRIVRANRAMTQRLGAHADECVGKHCYEVVHGTDCAPAFCPHAESVADGQAHVAEMHENRLDGDFLVSVTPLVDGEGQRVGAVHVARDISKRKQAEEALRQSHHELERRVQERTTELVRVNRELEAEITERQRAEAAVSEERQRLHDLLERLPVYVILLTPDHHVPFANRFFRERFGDSHGRRCFEYLFERAEPCETCETYKVLKTGAPHEWEWLGPDGRNYQIFDYPFTDTDGSPRIMEMGIDVTEQRRLETALRDLNEGLEQRVAARTAELATANRELEAFAYSVSHDLRAPLRAIDGFSQALLEDYGARLDAEGRSHLQRSRAASQRMGRLIDGLLSLSRTTRTEMRPTAVDLSALAHATAGELQKSEPARAVEFAIAPRLRVNADANLVRILLQNLLGNAWKFTHKHAEARIEVGAHEHAGETVYFVRDDGAGFDMAYADKLFGAFQRLHAQTEFEGTGIGLATVQRIVHRHGGRVWAEGAVEKGATFYFTLPTEPRS